MPLKLHRCKEPALPAIVRLVYLIPSPWLTILQILSLLNVSNSYSRNGSTWQSPQEDRCPTVQFYFITCGLPMWRNSFGHNLVKQYQAKIHRTVLDRSRWSGDRINQYRPTFPLNFLTCYPSPLYVPSLSRSLPLAHIHRFVSSSDLPMNSNVSSNESTYWRPCSEGICYCDWRLTITHCYDEDIFRYINLVIIALTSCIIAVGKWFKRDMVRLQVH